MVTPCDTQRIEVGLSAIAAMCQVMSSPGQEEEEEFVVEEEALVARTLLGSSG